PTIGEPRITYWRNIDQTWNYHLQDGNNEILVQCTQGLEGAEAVVLRAIDNARDAFDRAVPVRRDLA
ncbi:MAG: hypothetical protein ABIO71_10865, partial [Caldimonas sp.]